MKEHKCSKCGEVIMRLPDEGGIIIKPNPHKCKALKWSEMSERERDALVAEKVMGWTYRPAIYAWGELLEYGHWRDERGEIAEQLPMYSGRIADAWPVAEKLRSSGKTMDLLVRTKLFTAVVTDEFDPNQYREFQELARESAPTAEQAICLAALKACGVEIES